MAKDKKEKKKEKPQRKIIKKATKAKAKKHWFPLVGPKSFDNASLGESHVDTVDKLVGKSITVNLMHLTNDMRNQGIEIRFDVVKVQDGKGLTAVTSYEVLPSHMKRVVRRGRSKIMDSFIVRCGKDCLVRIKPMVFTANRASKGAKSAIRLAVRQRIKELLAQTTFDRLVQDLIGYKLQRALKDVAVKSHPIKSVEIKACTLLPGDVEVREEDGEIILEKPDEEADGTDLAADDAEEDAAEDVEQNDDEAENDAEEAAGSKDAERGDADGDAAEDHAGDAVDDGAADDAAVEDEIPHEAAKADKE